MKLKLSIIIFIGLLTVFYLQMVSCKKNPENPQQPVYSNYTGIISRIVAADTNVINLPIEGTHYGFEVEVNDNSEVGDLIIQSHSTRSRKTETYLIGMPSDMNKIKDYAYKNYTSITIKATFSNHFMGKILGDVSKDKYLFDITVIEAK